MIVCLFGVRYREGYDQELESDLDALLHVELRQHSGFLSLHTYRSEDGETLGVARFITREDLEAWRDNPTHRSVWRHASDLYETFWIQNAETYREYGWARDRGRTGEDLTDRFVGDLSNVARKA